MTDEVRFLLGVMAGLVGLSAGIPYIRSIISKTARQRTVPSRSSWLIWTILSIIMALSYEDVGGKIGLNLAWVLVVNTFIILCLSLKYGKGGWEMGDRWCLAVVLCIGVVWYFFPGLALVLCIGMDAVGLWPTIRKSWKDPNTENKAGWALITLASVINLAIVEELSWSVAGYPAWSFLGCGAMTLVLYTRRNTVNQNPRPS